MDNTPTSSSPSDQRYQLEDDELYKDIKRGDLVLLWSNDLPRGRKPAVVVEVHSARSLTLLPIKDRHVDELMDEATRQQLLESADAADFYLRVPRFNRGGNGERHFTWCGVH